MDDEEVITAVAANILKEIGYTADTAADGQEAVEKYTQAMESGDPFDAAIMDLTVPGGMGGEEAVKKLLSIDPEAKVIVSSGYSNSPVFADYTRYGFKACMPKPYDIEELKHILKKVLSG
jgi:CheY-like chemotaxis protein